MNPKCVLILFRLEVSTNLTQWGLKQTCRLGVVVQAGAIPASAGVSGLSSHMAELKLSWSPQENSFCSVGSQQDFCGSSNSSGSSSSSACVPGVVGRRHSLGHVTGSIWWWVPLWAVTEVFEGNALNDRPGRRSLLVLLGSGWWGISLT